MTTEPPVAKYKHTFIVRGNSHQEIQDELLTHVNGGYLLDSDYERRDTFVVDGGRTRSILEHTNPGMTPERYNDDLEAFVTERRRFRREEDHR